MIEMLRCRLLAGFGGTLLCALLASNAALAGEPVLMIHPTEVLFEGRERGAIVNLINRGEAPAVFQIEWVDYRMTPEGGLFVERPEAPWSLQPHVRLSPRRVRLEPGQHQVVRLALRPSAEVQRGEYYSHLRVLTLEGDEHPGRQDEQRPDAAAIKVIARTAMAIPVIWRNTREAPEATITGVRVDAESGQVFADVRRHGGVSLRGTLRLLEPGVSGEAAESDAESVPVVIYTNLTERRFALPLPDPARERGLAPGLQLVLASRSAATDRETVLATFALGN